MDKHRVFFLFLGLFAIILVMFFLIIIFNTLPRTENKLLLAVDYIDRAEYDRALDLLETILIRTPQNTRALALRELTLAHKNKLVLPDESVTNIPSDKDRSTDSNQTPKFSAPEIQGTEILSQQQTAQQLAQKQEAARLAKLSEAESALAAQINDLLAEAHEVLLKRQFSLARSLIQKAIDLDSKSALAYARLAETYVLEDIHNSSNRSKAIEFAEIAIKNDKELWEPYYTLGRVYETGGEYERAIEEYSKAARLNNNNPDILYSLGNVQFDLRQYNAAYESYEGVLQLDPSNERALFNLGLTYERLGRISSAITNYRAALSIRNDYSAAHNRIGELLLEQGELNSALQSLKKAVSYDNNARNNRAIARVLYEQGNYYEALEYFLTVLTLEPNLAQNQYNVATVLLDLNRGDEALIYVAEALRQDTTIPEYNYTMGLILKSLEDFEQAKNFFYIAIREKSDYIKPRIEIADIFILEQDYDAALEELLKVYQIDSTRADVNNNLATVYRLKELFSDSLRYSTAAIELEPKGVLIRYNLALTLIKLERFVQAESTLRFVINLDTHYLDAYLRLGEVLLAQEKSNEALKILNDLIATDPGTVQADQASKLINSLDI